MAWTYQIDEGRRIVLVRVYGDLCDRDLIEGNSKLRNDPDFRSDYRELVDLREARGAEVTPAGVRALAGQPPLFLAGSRRAIVAPTDLGFGMARMFEMLRGDQSGEIQVFRDLDEAKEWLGLE